MSHSRRAEVWGILSWPSALAGSGLRREGCQLPAGRAGEEDRPVRLHRVGIEARMFEQAPQLVGVEETYAAGGEDALETTPVTGPGTEKAHYGEASAGC